MDAFSFIHASDLHLGSPFAGIGQVSKEAGEFLVSSTLGAFDRLIGLAVSRGVDFVLFSGDLFDCAERNLRALLHFRNGVKALEQKGIQVFIVHGNHDPLDEISGALELPGNCHVFSWENNKWKIIRKKGSPLAAVFGMSFPRRVVRDNLARRIPAGPPGLFRIAMLHCTVGRQEGHDPYAPCALSDLTARHGKGEPDYWALGHVHTRKVLSEDPFVIYPGMIQGRSFAEQGEKGAFLVRVSGDKEVTVGFHPLDVVRWQEIEIDIASLSGPGELMDQAWRCVEEARKAAGARGLVLRIFLTGRSELSRQLGRQEALSDMLSELRDGLSDVEPPLWLDSIKNRSRRPIDIETRRQAPDLVGMLLRQTEAMKRDPQLLELAEKELSASFGKRRFMTGDMRPEEIAGLLEEAETMLLDLLEE